MLDIRIFNTDRHAGNLLVGKLGGVGRFGRVELIPIDHGLCLPETLEDPYFEWIHWPQVSIPFSDDELGYIEKLDPGKDCDMLRMHLPMIREACLEFRPGEEEPSELELVCIEARRLIAEREAFSPRGDLGDDQEFQFDLDCDETQYEFTAKLTADDYMIRSPFQFGIGAGSGRFPLSKLEESIEEDEDSDGEEEQEGFAALRTV
ncbi:hypothetical protein NC652_034286 [Populus alba x Populus x berolinensis]|nr:hypothetical protein NC652_034286 [Populus alba x Populus x berolinensis]